MNDQHVSRTILIVDDAPHIVAFLHNLLQTDYQIFFASDGKKALQTATSQKIDLILLDIMMPEMDGFAVCRELKKLDSTKDIPVIFLTATTDGGEENRCFELGAVDFIAKPINPLVVKARIKTHILLRASLRKLKELNFHLLHERETIEEIVSNIPAFS